MSRYFLDDYGFKIPEIPGVPASGYTFCPQYQAVYDYWPAPPDAAYAQQQDIMVRALVAAGIWAKLDVFYMFAQNDSGNALANWINPGTYDAIVVNGPIAWVQWQGFSGNAVNQYLNTQYQCNIHATNYALNSAHASIYIRTNSAVNYFDFGASDGVRWTALRANWGSNDAYHYINDGTADLAANGNSSGFFIVNRGGANSKITYRNGAILINDVTASTGVPQNRELYIGCVNSAGVPAFFSNREYSQFSLGASFDATERAAYQGALETYMDYLGTGVIP